MKVLNKLAAIALLSAVTFSSCLKDQEFNVEQEVFFATPSATESFRIVSPGLTYKIPIGLTAVSGVDRTISVSIASRSAVEGTHYTINTKAIVIPAGEAVDTLVLSGNYNQYINPRKDTLEFTISAEGVPTANFNSKFTLILRGACVEEDVNIGDMAGDYNNTLDIPYPGAYGSSISSPSSTGATSGTAVVNNIYAAGISADVNFEWSTPGVFTANIPEQATGFTVGGEPLSIRSTPGTTSTFTFCSGSITLYIDLFTPSGIFDRYTMSMER